MEEEKEQRSFGFSGKNLVRKILASCWKQSSNSHLTAAFLSDWQLSVLNWANGWVLIRT